MFSNVLVIVRFKKKMKASPESVEDRLQHFILVNKNAIFTATISESLRLVLKVSHTDPYGFKWLIELNMICFQNGSVS